MTMTFIKLSFVATLFVVSTYVSAEDAIVKLDLPTMNCATCPFTVKKALNKVEGVLEAEVSYKTKDAKVRFDDSKTSALALTQATTNAGYPSTIKSEVSNEK